MELVSSLSCYIRTPSFDVWNEEEPRRTKKNQEEEEE
jgi:hypothetical protein